MYSGEKNKGGEKTCTVSYFLLKKGVTQVHVNVISNLLTCV